MNFDEIIKQAENIDEPTQFDTSIKEMIWKKERAGRVTSSQLPKFMSGGVGSAEYGKQFYGVVIQTKGERRTGESFDKELDIYNFRWGRENEPKALIKVKEKFAGIIGGAEGENIIFNKFGDIFGDSPDFDGEKIIGEIKSPVDRVKIESERDPIQFYTENKKGGRSYHEYFWQMIGHLIGKPEAEKCIYVVYDGYTDEAYFHELPRVEVLGEIEKAKARLLVAENAIKESELNNWSNEPIFKIE